MAKQHTSTLTAKSDDGNQYTIYVLTDFIDAGTFSNPHAVIEGLKELRTSDGLAVNRKQKGEYEVVQTGIVLHSSSPNAA